MLRRQFSHSVEEWSLHEVDRILPSMACQSFRDRNVLSHIHTNAERRVPLGVYDMCLGRAGKKKKACFHAFLLHCEMNNMA